jgi:hypothetical protein
MIYPCTLPPWLPVEDIRTMVDEYESMLRNILRGLTVASTPQPRTSNDSEGYSPSSSIENGAEASDIMHSYPVNAAVYSLPPPDKSLAGAMLAKAWPLNRKAGKG